MAAMLVMWLGPFEDLFVPKQSQKSRGILHDESWLQFGPVAFEEETPKNCSQINMEEAMV